MLFRSHGSLPHKAPDPILAAAEMIMMFQQIQSRAVAPLDAAIFMMNKIEGGTAPNIISEEVHMCGNARSYTNEARKTIDDYARKIAESVEMVSGCKINVDPHYGYDACFNDPELYGKLMPVMESALGKEHVETFAEPMGFSEDYSFYSTLTGVPSLFLILQAGSTGPVASLHNAQCSMREEAMPYGMAAMMSCALELLK